MTMLLAAGVNQAACAGSGVEDELLEPEDQQGDDAKFEAWNQANNPTAVDPTFLLFVNQLPLKGGREVAPIPGDYWAVAKDGLNVKWDGPTSLSPAAKYAKAFGRTNVPEEISLANGVKGSNHRKACTTNADCTDQMDGSICATAFDGSEKRCIPTWWGICHGWAPYALMERAPRNPVKRIAADGTEVVFYPGDIEGLMSLSYTEVPTKFISSRCNKDNPPTDGLGRVIDGTCRDMNAGAWHVLVGNMMGVRKVGFVLDQTYDDEVWNQPTWKYEITNGEGGALRELSKDEAIEKLGLGQNVSPLLTTTTLRKGEQKTGEHTATAAGEVTVKLSGEGDADLYVRKGSAPTMSEYDCRPYGGSSVEECKITLAAGDKLFWMIDGYATESKVQLNLATAGQGGTYTYNTSAKRFFYVEMDFTFIVESQPARTSNIDNAAQYSSTKHYTYILETDDQGRIVGGEWTGATLKDHPDFAWWPTSTPSPEVAGVRYADLKALTDESAGITPGGPSVHELLTNVLVAASGGTWKSKYVGIDVPAGKTKLTVKMTGTGDADLYIGFRNRQPTVYTHACKSVTAGTSSETCTITVTPGTYTVRARSKTAGTTVSVTATLE